MNKILFLLLMFGGLSYCEDDTLVVAAGKSFKADALNSSEIRSMYRGKRFRLGNEKIILLNLETDSSLRRQFEQDVLHTDREELARNWLQAHYQGHKVPKVFKSSESVAEFLSKIENSIGYLDEQTAQKYGLKILFRVKEQQ